MKRTVGLFVAAMLAACGGSSNGGGFLDQKGQQPGGDQQTPGDQTQPTDNGENGFSLVDGLTISEVAVYQAIKVDVMKDGAKVAKRNAGLAAERDSFFRVFVKPGADFDGREVRAELRIFPSDGGKPVLFKDTKSLSRASTDASLDSTFNFKVPGENLPEGSSYLVSLIDATAQKTKATDSPAQYPMDASAPEALGLKPTGTLKIVIVPVQYNGDGSGRTPDTSQSQLDTYKSVLASLYPASKVDISMHAPYPFSSRVSGNGSGWNTLLQSIMRLRQSDGVADDVYYYGAFEAASSFSAFCQGGCVTGLSTVAQQPEDSYARASIGVGFSGDDAAYTMAHEVGHAHGREHSPCGGAGSPDPYYPYSGGAIGVWGYDPSQDALISPTKGSDIMGYCPNQWISDYTYNKLFERMVALSGTAQSRVGGAAQSQSYQTVEVAADGTLTWGDQVTVHSVVGGELRTARFLNAAGVAVGTGEAHYYKYDHIPGGFMLVPSGMPMGATRVSVEGFDKVLTRIAMR